MPVLMSRDIWGFWRGWWMWYKTYRSPTQSEMKTGGHTGYTRASVKNLDVRLRAHKSQPLSKGLTNFLDFFLWLLWTTGNNLSASPASKAFLQTFSASGQVSSGCTSAILHYYLESPSDICQDLYFPWKLPPFKSASLVAHLKSPSTTEFKTVGFKRLHVRQGVRSTWQVSGTTTPMQPENAASPQPGVSGPCTPFSTLLRALTASSAWAAVSHVVPALATEHLESCW